MLGHSLNDKIKRENERRNEDAATTKAVLVELNTSLNKRMDSQFTIVQSLTKVISIWRRT